MRPLRGRTLACAAGALLALAPTALAGSETVLVRVDPTSTRAERAVIGRALDAESVRSLPGGWREYRLAAAVSIGEARSDLSGVDAADAVRMPQPLRPVGVTNDPYLLSGQQWGLRNTGATGGTPGLDIGAPDGWSALTRRGEVVVAVVDTGVQTTHPDLAGRIWTNADEVPGNGIDDDGNGYVDDANGYDFDANDATVYDDATGDRHGTHVAGIIAATADDGVGMAGVAPNARIMPLKFIGSDGTGWNSDAVRGIQYAVDNGATVINGSFGGGSEDPVLCAAIAWAASRGVTFVAAAGNSGQDIGVTGTWPARCAEPTMVTVVAVTPTGGLASFSNRSPVHTDVGAPGQGVLSTVPGGYASMSGTSMAAPHVSGVIAAMLGETPALTPAQRRDAVMQSGTPLPALSGTTVSGRMVSLPGAVSAAVALGGGDALPPAEFALGAPADAAATASSRPLFTWSAATDDGTGVAGYRLIVDGVPTDAGAATQATPAQPLADGVHTWAVEAVDGAGNVRRSPTRTLVVDATAPSAPAITAPAAGTVASRITVVWRPSLDDTSGVSAYEVLLDGAVAVRLPGAATSGPLTVPAGAHRVTVRAVDAAGNASAGAERVFTVAGAARRAPRVVVSPRPVRLGGRTVVRVRATAAARVTLVAGTSRGVRVARLRVIVPKGRSTVALPRTVARRIGTRGTVGLATVAAARR